jgi:protein kinase-like protein/WD40 repeat protein
MALAAGARIGSYEIVALLGAGGMGEVYRATDHTLARDVAIKVLPDAVAADPDRLARFRREAQVLASLNHPHIAAIYGFEQSDGIHALVPELVEGQTLADQESDIWIWDFKRQTLQRLTFDPGFDRAPVWTPDGRRVIFSSQRGGITNGGNLFWQAFDGTGTVERLTAPNTPRRYRLTARGYCFVRTTSSRGAT